MDSTANQHSSALQKLVSSIKQPKMASDIGNLMCFYEENIVVWNGDDQSLYICTLDDQHSISNTRVITLTNPPVFSVSTLTLSPHGDYLALSGSNGLMVVELPPHWTFHHSDSNSNAAAASVVKSTSIGERMFLCNQNLKLLCMRWHPFSKKHILILNNDDNLRLFDIENEFEPVKTILLNPKSANELHFERISVYSNSFGENAVSFDFGPSLSRYHHIESIDIYPVYILRGNGDVLLLYLSLKDLFICDKIFGPLKMTPAAEDNYGSDACTILCLDCVPPMVVIGTTSGLLYHCIAIENECDEEREQEESFQEIYSFLTSCGIHVVIPESVLFVLETIELSFPLAFADHEAHMYHTNELNASLQLMADIRDPKRYFCQHSFGIHIVMLSFLKQLSSPSFSEFHDEKSIVEYLICTRPTIEKNATDEFERRSFPIGVALFVTRGFTYIAVLLNSAELICKRLSNVLLPDTIGDIFPVKNGDIELNNLIASNKQSLLNDKQVNSSATDSPRRKATFPEHLEKILQRNTCLPLIKSSKGKNSAVSVQELQMLLNSIDVLKKEYLEKFSLAAKSIEQRKKVLKNMCQVQLNEVDNLREEKEHILSDYVNLVKKYDIIKESQSALSDRLDRKITEIQYQRPTLSDAELSLKRELSHEQENIILYRQKLEQIKRKHRYQDAQLLKSKIGDEQNQKCEFMLSSQLKNIKEMLAYQGEQISELVSSLNGVKSNC